jgi:hypothetical protein
VEYQLDIDGDYGEEFSEWAGGFQCGMSWIDRYLARGLSDAFPAHNHIMEDRWRSVVEHAITCVFFSSCCCSTDDDFNSISTAQLT